jgi:hypothetical protein
MNPYQTPLASLPGSPEKKQESCDAQKVLRLLARRLKPLGFARAKPTFFTRPAQCVLEFVHVHKYSFGPSFRVHLGVRVRSDGSPGPHLNGPSSDEIADPASPNRRLYDFDFTASEASWSSCAEAMYQCVENHGLAWFASVANPSVLLAADSPLTESAKAALQRELADIPKTYLSEQTQRLLNAT